MHRNTQILLIFLAIAAAIVVGVNLTKGPEQPGATTQTKPTPSPTPPKLTLYELPGCGISFPLPEKHMVLEGPGTNVVFTSNTGGDTIVVTCQKNIPRPAIPENQTKAFSFKLPDKPSTSFPAILYHDKSAKDETPVDKLIFKHPTNDMDIYISGTGEAFQLLIANLNILR